MRDALMTERSGPACIILRRVKKRAACKKTFSLFRKLPRFGVPEEIRTPDPTLRSSKNLVFNRVPVCPVMSEKPWNIKDFR